MTANIERALRVLDPEQFWINPDCGLKTRGWQETEDALRNMVKAAAIARENAGVSATK
ncbi:5-methyltetrahydropteroyltriglutamate--homocysteine methyltransferase [compost metagenome]